MALPVILIDSATGSDTAASGAGPATALTGSSASTDGAGTLVTLDGSPDLSGVATDGSHVIYLADTTAGARNFGKITAKDDIAKTVTVSNAFGLSLSGKSWAIGGKRASIASTTSKKLFDNNATAGDAMPGWVVEMQSGHSETLSAANALRFYRGGNTTDGIIALRGTSGAATRPRIDISVTSGNVILFYAPNFMIKDFDIRYTAASNGTCVLLYTSSVSCIQIDGIKISGSTNNAGTGMNLLNQTRVTHCEIANCDTGISGPGAGGLVENCWIHDCTNDGISMNSDGGEINNCIIGPNISDDGIVANWTGNQYRRTAIRNTTIIATGDGIQCTSSPAESAAAFNFDNIYIHSAGGYGINFGSLTLAQLQNFNVRIRNCGFRSCTSGNIASALSSLLENCVTSADPNNANFGTGGDFTLGSSSNLKGVGCPSSVIGMASSASSRSYVDIGAVQRQESGASRILPGMRRIPQITRIQKSSIANSAPSISDPGSISVAWNATTSFGLTITDADNDRQSVSLSWGKGTFTLASVSFLTFTVGDGTADAAMEFSGPLTAVNTALATITLTPDSSKGGSSTFIARTYDGFNALVTRNVTVTLTPAIPSILFKSTSTRYQTTDTSTPSNVGNPTGRIQNEGTGSYNATQSSSGLRPTNAYPDGDNYDGSDDCLTVAYSTDFDFGSSNWSVTININPDLNSGRDFVLLDNRKVSTGDGIVFFINSTGKLSSFSSGSLRVTGSTTVTTGSKHYVTYNRNGNVMDVWLDGVKDGTYNATGFSVPTPSDTLVIARRNDNQVPFDGKIAFIRVEKGVALSDQQINYLHGLSP